MFAEITERYGRLDILVNNAADGHFVDASDVTPDQLDRAWDTNVKGSLRCARLARPLMARSRGGAIVNLSTLGGGELVMHGYTANGPAKAAVESLTRYLAVEFAADGIRVNTAAAGMLASPVADQFPDAAAMQSAVVEATPLGRLGDPAEFAEVIAFLAGPKSSWITGQVILADGGLSCGHALLSPRTVSAAPPAPAMAPATEEPTDAVEPDGAETPDEPEIAELPAVDDEVVIVGMGIVVSGAADPDAYWSELIEGPDRFTPVPADRWDIENFWAADHKAEDKTYSRHSAFVMDDIADRATGREPGEYTRAWLRHALRQGLDGVAHSDTDKAAFFVGYTADGSQHLEEATVVSGVETRLDRTEAASPADPTERSRRRALLGDALRRRYPRSGPDPLRFFPDQVGRGAMRGVLPDSTEVLMVDTACSSSLYTIDLGVKGLDEGRYDIAVCGGSFALGPRGSILFAKLNGLSARGEVRSMDASGDGVLFADGAAVVVLKKLSRARADGDRILGTVRAVGSSSDGKGKAIYAPKSEGQQIAIERARQACPSADRPNWIVAHATGTPAGDSAEFATLRTTFAGDEEVLVSSNKSVIGHTGWAAGVVSVIEVLLALRHDQIPPQHRFVEPPAAFGIDSTNLRIATEAQPWPAIPGGRRTAAVSGFGFGGTNAHLILAEAPDPAAPIRVDQPSAEASTAERIVVVGRASLRPEDGLSFGAQYPLPSTREVVMPPGMMRAIDRTQLMVLNCAGRLRADLGEFWAAQKATTGVVLGHMGATRNATLYATRCYLDDLRVLGRTDPALAGESWYAELVDEVGAELAGLVPPSSENTFPGMMPNVIPARVANYFDLNGLNMTVDTGFTSLISALDVAGRYLRSGELTMALAGAISGNSTQENRDHLAAELADGQPLGEGCFLYALTTESTARAHGLPVLGYVHTHTAGSSPTWSTGLAAATDPAEPHLMAAHAGPALERALDAVASGSAPGAVVSRTAGGESSAAISVSAEGDPAASEADTGTPATAHVVRRHVIRPVPDAGTPRGARTPCWVPGRTVVLTDSPAAADEARRAGVTTVGLVGAAGAAPAGVAVLSETPSRDTVAAWLGAEAGAAAEVHLRVLVDCAHSATGSETTDRLHESAFLATQLLAERLDRAESSWMCIALDGYVGQTPRPIVGLFRGLTKVAHLEFAAPAFLLVTDESEVARAAELAAAESRLDRTLPVAYLRSGVRSTDRLTQRDAVDGGALPIGADSLVVSVGGGRGIAAELLIDLARRATPRIVVLGSNRIDSHPARYLQMDAETFAGARAGFIREFLGQPAVGERTSKPTIKDATRAFDRIADARVVLANLDRMRAAGATVEYRACDATHPGQVRETLDAVSGGRRIDLLINVAGVNRSAPIRSKSLAEFRMVRNLKTATYRNLRAALDQRPPRIWVNFGSLLGLTGQIGEADYASGNDFLAAAAVAASGEGRATRELTIGWTLWGETGLGANELTKAYFEKSGMYSAMTSAEGIDHFIAELSQPVNEPLTIHLGDAECAAVERLLPGFASAAPLPADPVGTAEAGPSRFAAPPAPTVATPPRFYLDRVVEQTADRAVFERTFDLDRDGYLRHHAVRGAATLPGTFVSEIAYEAASALVPGAHVTAIRDLEFLHFLKVPERGRPAAHRILAEVIDRRTDLGRTTVRIQVLADVTAPNGTVLIRDREHFRAEVDLSEFPSVAPEWQPWPALAETAVTDPYHVPSAPVLLTGPFVSTRDTRIHPWGRRSTLGLDLGGYRDVFSGFGMPVITLDGLARTGVLSDDPALLPIAAPLSIGRIDVYAPTSDVALSGMDAQLYAVVDHAADGTAADTVNHFAAVGSDGRVITQFRRMRWTVLGYLQPETGAYLTQRDLDNQPAPHPVGTR